MSRTLSDQDQETVQEAVDMVRRSLRRPIRSRQRDNALDACDTIDLIVWGPRVTYGPAQAPTPREGQ